MDHGDKDQPARAAGPLAPTGAAPDEGAALAACLAHIARLRHLRRLPSPAAARAAGWSH
jgi:hypothetical protein